MTTTATRGTTMVRHRRSTDSLNSYLAFSTHSFVNMLVTNRMMARHAFTICHAYLTRSLWARIHHAWGTMYRRSSRLGANGALMHYTLERSDARHSGGTPSSSGVLMKLASRGTNTRPTLSLLLHETKLQGGLKEEEWSSFLIFSMERTGEELLVGGGGGVGEVSGSTFSWVQEAGEEVTTGAAPDVGAKFHGVAKAS
jgi:hypothetical protein